MIGVAEAELATLVTQLKMLVELLKSQKRTEDPEFYMAQISSSQPWVVDYRGRKHLYLLSSVALTLSSTDIGSIPILTGGWNYLDLEPGQRVYASAQTSPVYLYVMATDEIVPTLVGGSVSVVNFPAGFNVTNFPASFGITSIAPAALADATANPTTDSFGSDLQVFNGVTWDRLRGLNGNAQIAQSSNNAAIPAASGTVSVKATAGDLVTLSITTAGTVAFKITDDTGTGAGNVLYQSVAAPALGVVNIFGRAKNGITVVGGGAGGAALTVFYN